jgi:hypothetical protein
MGHCFFGYPVSDILKEPILLSWIEFMLSLKASHRNAWSPTNSIGRTVVTVSSSRANGHKAIAFGAVNYPYLRNRTKYCPVGQLLDH